MKKILTISSSLRPKGNGETLLKLCEKNISKSDFIVESVSLKNFTIKNCTGCMSCAIKKEFCKIDDDLKKLIDQILNCDVLIISSPVYFLGATSTIKAINDRLLSMHNYVDYDKRKPAGIIITAGRKGWEGSAIQNVSILLLSLGFNVKDVLLTHAQGPSEILLTENIEEKSKSFVNKILDPDYKVPNLNHRCPICLGGSFNIVNSNTVKCPICNISGKITGQKDNKTLIFFSESDINNNRWSSKNLKDHMENWVEESGQKYREKVKEIIRLRKKLLDI